MSSAVYQAASYELDIQYHILPSLGEPTEVTAIFIILQTGNGDTQVYVACPRSHSSS